MFSSLFPCERQQPLQAAEGGGCKKAPLTGSSRWAGTARTQEQEQEQWLVGEVERRVSEKKRGRSQ